MNSEGKAISRKEVVVRSSAGAQVRFSQIELMRAGGELGAADNSGGAVKVVGVGLGGEGPRGAVVKERCGFAIVCDSPRRRARRYEMGSRFGRWASVGSDCWEGSRLINLNLCVQICRV